MFDSKNFVKVKTLYNIYSKQIDRFPKINSLNKKIKCHIPISNIRKKWNIPNTWFLPKTFADPAQNKITLLIKTFSDLADTGPYVRQTVMDLFHGKLKTRSTSVCSQKQIPELSVSTEKIEPKLHLASAKGAPVFVYRRVIPLHKFTLSYSQVLYFNKKNTFSLYLKFKGMLRKLYRKHIFSTVSLCMSVRFWF